MNKDYQLYVVKCQNTIAHLLDAFKVGHGEITFTPGPAVTRFELNLEFGTRISKIRGLKDEIAAALGTQSVRIIAPTERGTVAIEVTNKVRQIVGFSDMLWSSEYENTTMQLPLCIGRKADNSVFMADLANMPHLLVAGATGMGKSVGLNVILMSLLNKLSPEELKLVLIDPKQVELSAYNTIAKPYIARLADSEDAVITDLDNAKEALDALIPLMESRYKKLKEAGARNITEYNRLTPDDKLPYYVVVIDEYGDLIMQQNRGMNIETAICRIAQKARAVGIHMIISTQRPDAKIVTGSIKANFPARIAFRTASGVDSRVILNRMGAETLAGKGDMLYYEGCDLIRCQCAYIPTEQLQEQLQEMADEYDNEEQKYLPKDTYHEATVNKPIDTRFDGAFPSSLKAMKWCCLGLEMIFEECSNAGIIRQLQDLGIISTKREERYKKWRFLPYIGYKVLINSPHVIESMVKGFTPPTEEEGEKIKWSGDFKEQLRKNSYTEKRIMPKRLLGEKLLNRMMCKREISDSELSYNNNIIAQWCDMGVLGDATMRDGKIFYPVTMSTLDISKLLSFYKNAEA